MASTAAAKMKNFPQNPASGGIPASEIMNIAIAKARPGARRPSPAKSEISAPGASRDSATTTPNAPRFITP